MIDYDVLQQNQLLLRQQQQQQQNEIPVQPEEKPLQVEEFEAPPVTENAPAQAEVQLSMDEQQTLTVSPKPVLSQQVGQQQEEQEEKMLNPQLGQGLR